jgi:hypothetical protein
MKIRVYAYDLCTEDRRVIEDCICDNVNRALQMYEDECCESEVLEYEFIN